jgi:hypothetical protein
MLSLTTIKLIQIYYLHFGSKQITRVNIRLNRNEDPEFLKIVLSIFDTMLVSFDSVFFFF